MSIHYEPRESAQGYVSPCGGAVSTGNDGLLTFIPDASMTMELAPEQVAMLQQLGIGRGEIVEYAIRYGLSRRDRK